MTVLAGIGGDWHTLEGTSDQKWLSQTGWYIDSVTGDDENNGTTLAPLKTAEEIQRRWGSNPFISVPITVTVLSSVVGNIFLKGTGVNNAASITIQGTAVPILSDTISAFTPFSHGVYEVSDPTPTVLTITSVTDFTQYLGKRVRSGTLLSWLDIVNPTGLGVSTASSSPWGSMGSGGSQNFTQGNPTVGNQCTIEDLTVIDSIRIDWVGAEGSSVGHPWVTIQDFDIISSVNVQNVNRGANVRVYGCNLRDTAFSLTNFEQRIPQFTLLQSCAIRANSSSFSSSYAGCLFTNAFATLMGTSGLQNYIYCLVRTTLAGQNCWNVEVCPASSTIQHCQGFSALGSVILFQSTSAFNVVRIINSSGKAGTNQPGVRLRDSVSVLFDSAQSYNIRGSGTGADLSLASNSTLGVGGFRWADCLSGFTVGEWQGQATLDGGSVDVTPSPTLTDFFTSTSSISVSCLNPSGTQGNLSVPTATRTTSTFRIVSDVVSDNSQVNWKISSSLSRRAKVTPSSLV
jgi:hypothetical protein